MPTATIKTTFPKISNRRDYRWWLKFFWRSRATKASGKSGRSICCWWRVGPKEKREFSWERQITSKTGMWRFKRFLFLRVAWSWAADSLNLVTIWQCEWIVWVQGLYIALLWLSYPLWMITTTTLPFSTAGELKLFFILLRAVPGTPSELLFILILHISI